QRVERARGHPLLDRDVEHVLARVPRKHERYADAILEVPEQQVLAPERRERLAGEVGERDARIERPGVTVSQGGHAVAFSASSPRLITGVSAKRPLSIARISVSWPGTSARNAPTVHRSRARCAYGSKRYQRMAFSCVILAISVSVTPNCAATAANS